ncbi:peritrophin-1-like [Prorops nasuta]|uniref:peritrophin-1-like n=1 Tax=Prorops nasuta TaxID=863751 RepID=UPI0034CF2629
MKVIVVCLLVAIATCGFSLEQQELDCPAENEEYATLLPNLQDCSTYYVCNFGVPVLMPCPPGLEYNTEIFACDYPENANCQAVTPPADEIPESTETVEENN